MELELAQVEELNNQFSNTFGKQGRGWELDDVFLAMDVVRDNFRGSTRLYTLQALQSALFDNRLPLGALPIVDAAILRANYAGDMSGWDEVLDIPFKAPEAQNG